MLKIFFAALLIILSPLTHAAAEKILFVPHDARPVSFRQPAEVVAQLGYEIISPPTEILTAPDKLWFWINENAARADAAVISADSMLYGGLIPSRKHDLSAAELFARVENFKTLREKNPALQLYVFGSLMRTPYAGTQGDIEEPEYYAQFGADIFQYTKLLDKRETSTLTRDEKFYLETSRKNIPDEILNDWLSRREKNLAATKKLLDFAAADIINYFVLGRDDNAPLSQTHRENLKLAAYMNELGLPKTKAQSLAGIDEYAMLLLARAVNDLRGEIPFVNVQFNRGVGAKTVPAYSDETIEKSVREEILIAGALFVPAPARADFVLFVNTDPRGKTFHTHNSFPPQALTARRQKYFRRNAEYFSALVEDALDKNLPVGVADITFANGSDNALMNQLRDKNLLFKLQAYGGWNTATNSTGFALGTGVLTKKMSRDSKDRLLTCRYLDDWAFQANVRAAVAERLSTQPDGLQTYLNLGVREDEIVALENFLMKNFALENLPRLENFSVTNPWHRMFECEVTFADKLGDFFD